MNANSYLDFKAKDSLSSRRCILQLLQQSLIRSVLHLAGISLLTQKSARSNLAQITPDKFNNSLINIELTRQWHLCSSGGGASGLCLADHVACSWLSQTFVSIRPGMKPSLYIPRLASKCKK